MQRVKNEMSVLHMLASEVLLSYLVIKGWSGRIAEHAMDFGVFGNYYCASLTLVISFWVHSVAPLCLSH